MSKKKQAAGQTFWFFRFTKDEEENDSELDCEGEDEDEGEVEKENNSQYRIGKGNSDDANDQRVAAMKQVHQPIPGTKSGREVASTQEYLTYGKSLMSGMFPKISSWP